VKCVHDLFHNEFLEHKSANSILKLSEITFILDVTRCSYKGFDSYKNVIGAVLHLPAALTTIRFT
jgi:hypothetical protein